MASASIDDEPVNTAPTVLATAMARLAPRAKKMDLSESAWADMVGLCGDGSVAEAAGADVERRLVFAGRDAGQAEHGVEEVVVRQRRIALGLQAGQLRAAIG